MVSIGPEDRAFRIAIGLAALAGLSYAVARLAEPAAGLVLGVGALLAAFLAGAAAWIVRRRRMAGSLRGFSAVSVAVGVVAAALAAVLSLTLVFDRAVPAVAWAGFGIVTTVGLTVIFAVLGLALGADGEQHREASRQRATGADARRRVLLVADEACDLELCRQIVARIHGEDAQLRVVAPALNSPIRRWASDDDAARAAARRRLETLLAELADLGVAASGEVGADDPLQAIDDALRTSPTDEIVIATHAKSSSNWLEEGAVERARELYDVPIVHVVVGEPAPHPGGAATSTGARTPSVRKKAIPGMVRTNDGRTRGRRRP